MTPGGDATAATSEGVRAELVKLRQGDGLSAAKVQVHCAHIVRLPATTKELKRRRLAPSDRHIAALEVLQCAVQTLVPRTDFAQILQHTLNIQATAATSLGRRRTPLKALLRTSDKEYDRLERQAYDYFASALVAAEQSPCAIKLNPLTTDAELRITVQATPQVLSQLLNALSLESRSMVRHVQIRNLFEMLPRAQLFTSMARRSDVHLALLLRSLAPESWRGRPPQQLDSSELADALRNNLDPAGVAAGVASDFGLNAAEGESFAVRDQHIDQLAIAILAAESDDAWRRLVQQ